MTHLLHDYLARQLADRLQKRRVVVWYDPRRDFSPFVHELAGPELADPGTGLHPIQAGDSSATLASYCGSMFEIRALVEPLVSGDEPAALVVYIPGMAGDRDSPLMELEKAGTRWKPTFKQVARNALRPRFTTGVIDDLLRGDNVTYHDIAKASTDGGGPTPSVLKSVLGGSDPEAQLVNWLAHLDLDASIVEKQAAAELRKLVAARLALDLEGDDLAKWRVITSRRALAVEFRSDLQGEPPNRFDSIPAATTETERRARKIADGLRAEHRAAYSALADQAARELGLSEASVDPLELGSIDTFRFEERALLARCAELVAAGDYPRVSVIANERQTSFWLAEDVERRAQWEAMRRAAKLGQLANEVEASLASAPRTAAGWIDNYSSCWHHLDRAHRNLEGWLPKLDDDVDERAISAVRDRYDEVLGQLAKGYVAALQTNGWSVEGALHQTAVFDDIVRPDKGRVAYFLVDAMRYEMGAELAEQLEDYGEVSITGAVGVLPSITTTGMAALMPGAVTNYDIVESGGHLAAKVDGALLLGLKARQKHLAARVPSSLDLDLGKVLSLSKAKLNKRIGKSNLIVVRSQEIDFFGEGGFASQARPVMDAVLDNLARAVRKLAGLGVKRVVIASDHGHLFAAEDRDDAMKIDSPGGGIIELHRRCWIGRGGTTPPGCIRVGARELGSDSDLEFVFPTNCGVFKSGGDLSFHHGGPTLQEMIIPVITVHLATTATQASHTAEIAVGAVPAVITNRIFSVKLTHASLLGTEAPVRPVLLTDGRQVGAVGMALGAALLANGTVTLSRGTEADIGFVLDDDRIDSLRIVILDHATDAELYRSPAEIPVDLGVS